MWVFKSPICLAELIAGQIGLLNTHVMSSLSWTQKHCRCSSRTEKHKSIVSPTNHHQSCPPPHQTPIASKLKHFSAPYHHRHDLDFASVINFDLDFASVWFWLRLRVSQSLVDGRRLRVSPLVVFASSTVSDVYTGGLSTNRIQEH